MWPQLKRQGGWEPVIYKHTRGRATLNDPTSLHSLYALLYSRCIALHVLLSSVCYASALLFLLLVEAVSKSWAQQWSWRLATTMASSLPTEAGTSRRRHHMGMAPLHPIRQVCLCLWSRHASSAVCLFSEFIPPSVFLYRSLGDLKKEIRSLILNLQFLLPFIFSVTLLLLSKHWSALVCIEEAPSGFCLFDSVSSDATRI